jgi:hypothetical protein
VSLVPKILVSSELWIVTLGLKDDANVAPQCAWINGCIESLNDCMPASGEHQRGEDSEKCCLPASIGPKQAEQLRITDFESDAIERSTVIVAVNEILNADNGTGGRADSGAGRGFLEDWDFTGHRSFYTVILRRYGVEHHEGEQVVDK